MDKGCPPQKIIFQTRSKVLWAPSNLTLGAWVPVVTNLADTTSAFRFADGQASDYPQRFYRVATQ